MTAIEGQDAAKAARCALRSSTFEEGRVLFVLANSQSRAGEQHIDKFSTMSKKSRGRRKTND